MMTARGATAATALALVLAVTPAWAQQWAVPEADARVPLTVETDLYLREEAQLQAVIDFNEMLGAKRTLAADSLTLLDVASQEVVPVELAEDAEIRYASGNPILRLRWSAGALGRLEERAWDLYFRTVEPGAEGAWVPLGETFTPAPRDVLLDTSFEQAHPDHDDRPVEMYPGGRDKEGETTERVWTEEEARTGEHALKIARVFEGERPQNSNRPHWRSWPPPFAVRPGQGLRFSAWLKSAELGESGMASVMLEFYGPENERLSEGRLWLRGPLVEHDWQELSGSTTAPVGAAFGVLWFSLHNEGTAYCDDMLVTALPGGALPELEVAVGQVQDRAAFAPAEEETAAAEGKVLACAVAEQPPTIDGALDDPCWQSAGHTEDFEEFILTPGTQVTTRVLACADREALYFGFECTEPSTESLLIKSTERDGAVWADDSVELFLDTNLDRRSFYQVIVNPAGVFFDQDTGAPGLAGPKWDGPITVATRVLVDRWLAEVRLAFTGLRLAETEGRVWGVNFARSSFRGGRSSYTWAQMDGGFLEPHNFGTLVLPFDPGANVVTGRVLAGDRIFWGEGTLGLEVTNRRDQAVEARVVVTEEAEAGRTVGEATVMVEPRGSVEARVPATFTQTGELRLRYDLFEADGTLLYTTSVTHTVPEPLAIEPDALVSYLDEDSLTGSWRLGVAEEALTQTRLELSVYPGGGGGEPVATQTIRPDATAGTFAVALEDVPKGRYELKVMLLQGGQEVGSGAVEFDRLGGPFTGE